MKQLMISLFTFLVASPAFALQGPSAHFDTDKSEVINETEITRFAESIRGSVRYIVLHCYADSRASRDYNISLAKERCGAVALLLEKRGLAVKTVVAVGEEVQLVPETGSQTDLHGRYALNRRVEVYYDLEEVKASLPEPKIKRHRVEALFGYAPSGLKPTKQTGPSEFVVEEDWDPEFGLGYSYRVTKHINVGVELFTNKSVFGKFGFDF